MKRFLPLLFSIILIVTLFSGCSSGGESGPEEPRYASVYSYDEYGHWYAQLNGDGIKGYQEHANYRGRCKCGGKYYFSDDVIYTLRFDADKEGNPILNEETGEPNFYYAVTEYLGEYDSDTHIEIPAMLCQPLPVFDEDAEDYNEIYAETILEYAEEIEYPVLVIEASVFKPTGNKISIDSIKLNEGLKTIGNNAFVNSSIQELIIPNSVEGSIYNTCGGCASLRRVVIGDGVTSLRGYCFSSCTNLTEVVLGKNIKSMGSRNFYCCSNLGDIVIPKSLVSIPEGHIYSNATKKYVSIFNQFQGAAMGSPSALFLEITEEEYNALVIPQMPRDNETGYPLDQNGNPVEPSAYKATTYGLVEGWNNGSKLYFKGEWKYVNGKPVAL